MTESTSHPMLKGIRNAMIRVDGAPPRLADLVFDDERIEAILEPGSLAEAGTIDAGGRTVEPGYVDAHMHLSLGGQTMRQLDLSGVRSREAFEAAITERAASLPEGVWLQALGWNEANWPGAERPTADWLHGAGERPTVCYRMDYHACVVNDAVLQKLDGADCPPGGEIVRDADGAPNGLMLESAAWHLVNPLVPDPTPEEARASVRGAVEHCAAQGLVAVGSMEYQKDIEEGLLPQREALGIRIRATLLERTWPLDFSFAEAFDGDSMLEVIGFKAFIDGTLGSRTAAMLDPYADQPEAGTGMLVELAEDGHLEVWINAVQQHTYSPSMHAIGDRALRLALDVADTLPEEARDWVRFEHAQTVHPDDVARMKGRFASMQPLHKASDAVTALERLGAGRMDRFFPFRTLLDAGARLAFGSDWPIVSCDPFEGIRAAVTGRDLEGTLVRPEENLTIEEAIRAYTTEARACIGLDGGTIAPDEPADLVLLDRDPRSLDWSVDPAPAVLATIVAGRLVHDVS